MSNKVKAIIAALVIGLGAMICWVVNSLPAPPGDGSGQDPQRIMTYDGNTISEEKNGKLVWRVTAEKIDLNMETNKASLTKVDAVFYTEDGRSVKLSAPMAEYDQNLHDIQIKGGVNSESSDGAKMHSESVEWLQKEGKLALAGNVQLERESDAIRVSADRIESSDAFAKFKATGHAHMEKGN